MIYVFPDIHLFGISEQNMLGIFRVNEELRALKSSEHSNLTTYTCHCLKLFEVMLIFVT